MELSYVMPRIIFDTVVGSRAYGIHSPDSDADRSGVMIPGIEYFFGFEKFEQFAGFEEKDRVVYDIRKAINLIADNNPNMMDLLFVPERCYVKITPYWQKVIENRDLFVSKKTRYTFSGYAISQLKRIRTHRKFLLNPPTVKPLRETYNLPEQSIFPTSQIKGVLRLALEIIIEEERPNFLQELDDIYKNYVMPLFTRYVKDDEKCVAMEWLQMGVRSQQKTFQTLQCYVKDEYYEAAERELKYYSACQEWIQYQEWKKKRNDARAELEKKFGFDTKHAAHLVRLLRMGKEILETGKVNVDRTNIDAEELKGIRAGSWKFEEIEQYVEVMDKELDKHYKESSLQKSPKSQEIKNLCVEIVDRFFKEEQKL
jgi:uncharacterized protein